MDLVLIIIVFGIGIIAGSFGVLVGGQSLLTLPILILLGIPPTAAIATNAFGVTGAPIAGWYKFHKKKLINYKIALLLAIPAIVGSVIGANIIAAIHETMLKKIIGIL